MSVPNKLDRGVFAERKVQARIFADRLRDAGLSIFEPDPQSALTAVAEARRDELHVVAEPTGDAA